MKLSELRDELHALQNMHPTASINRQITAVRRRIQQIHDERFGIDWGETITEPGLTIDVEPARISKRGPLTLTAPKARKA